MKYQIPFFLLALVVLVTVGCKRFDPEAQAKIDDDLIKQYIADNALIAQSSASGLHWVIDSLGSGVAPTLSDSVTVAYTGYFIAGTNFDQSSDSGVTFPLTAVIAGWQEGIPKFQEGGAGTLLIPSALGYGNTDQGSIPANSVLIFDVHLLDVR